MIACLASMFVSCVDTQTDKQPANEDEKQEITTAELTIAGKALSEFKIVYARSEYYNIGQKVFTTEWNFYKLTALDIQAKIKDLTGVELSVVQDTKTDEGANEILVGPTNRAESDVYDGLDVYTFKSFVKNGKLVLGGGYDAKYLTGDLKISYCWAATYHSFDAIESHIKEQMKSGSGTVELAEGFIKEGRAELTTVACIGDSITEGFKSTDWNYCSFPAVMQRLLWKDYVVINYGARGGSVRNDLKKPYTAQAQHTAAMEYAPLYDIAFIMLGTNDSNYDATFDKSDNDKFKSDYKALVDSLVEKNGDLEFVLMNCPVYYGSGSPAAPFIRSLQQGIYKTLKMEGYNVKFYDMYDFSSKNMDVSYFPDKIHPNDAGYVMMAEELAKYLIQISESTENK